MVAHDRGPQRARRAQPARFVRGFAARLVRGTAARERTGCPAAELARRGFDIPREHLERDWSQEYAASEAVEAAWGEVYRDPEKHWDLYELGEELTDLETAFRVWRFRHVTTVERIIGFKPGTGGTSGVSYLRKQLDIILFPELWAMRTGL